MKALRRAVIVIFGKNNGDWVEIILHMLFDDIRRIITTINIIKEKSIYFRHNSYGSGHYFYYEYLKHQNISTP